MRRTAEKGNRGMGEAWERAASTKGLLGLPSPGAATVDTAACPRLLRAQQQCRCIRCRRAHSAGARARAAAKCAQLSCASNKPGLSAIGARGGGGTRFTVRSRRSLAASESCPVSRPTEGVGRFQTWQNEIVGKDADKGVSSPKR